jgi:putative ABC transport system substrate-binding protein
LPAVADAQPSGLPVIGFLNQETEEAVAHPGTGFRKGMSETGFVVNRNVAIEYRWASARTRRPSAMVDSARITPASLAR